MVSETIRGMRMKVLNAFGSWWDSVQEFHERHGHGLRTTMTPTRSGRLDEDEDALRERRRRDADADGGQASACDQRTTERYERDQTDDDDARHEGR